MKINLNTRKEIATKARQMGRDGFTVEELIRLMQWAYKQGYKHGVNNE